MGQGKEPQCPPKDGEQGRTKKMSLQGVGEETKPRCLIGRPEYQGERKTSIQSLGCQVHLVPNIQALGNIWMICSCRPDLSDLGRSGHGAPSRSRSPSPLDLVSFVSFFKKSFIEVQFIYRVVIISAVQQSDPVIPIHISIRSQMLFPHRLSQKTGESSLSQIQQVPAGLAFHIPQRACANPKP